MNRKHLIQFVATVGAVLVLYVLSFGPIFAYALPKSDVYMSDQASETDKRRMRAVRGIYKPVLQGCKLSSSFRGIAQWYVSLYVSLFKKDNGDVLYYLLTA